MLKNRPPYVYVIDGPRTSGATSTALGLEHRKHQAVVHSVRDGFYGLLQAAGQLDLLDSPHELDNQLKLQLHREYHHPDHVTRYFVDGSLTRLGLRPEVAPDSLEVHMQERPYDHAFLCAPLGEERSGNTEDRVDRMVEFRRLRTLYDGHTSHSLLPDGEVSERVEQILGFCREYERNHPPRRPALERSLAQRRYTFPVTGAPGCGKTSTLLLLELAGKYVMPEAARHMIRLLQAEGHPEPWLLPDFQQKILDLTLSRELHIPPCADTVFMDRSRLDGLAYDDPGKNAHHSILDAMVYPMYHQAIILGMLPHQYESVADDKERREDPERTKALDAAFREIYGYAKRKDMFFTSGSPAIIEDASLEARAQHILDVEAKVKKSPVTPIVPKLARA